MPLLFSFLVILLLSLFVSFSSAVRVSVSVEVDSPPSQSHSQAESHHPRPHSHSHSHSHVPRPHLDAHPEPFTAPDQLIAPLSPVGSSSDTSSFGVGALPLPSSIDAHLASILDSDPAQAEIFSSLEADSYAPLPTNFSWNWDNSMGKYNENPHFQNAASPAAATVLTPIQHQGAAGTCWAFSVTAAMESIWAIRKGQLKKLSEQSLIDCSAEAQKQIFINFFTGYESVVKNGGNAELAVAWLLGRIGPPEVESPTKFRQLPFQGSYTPYSASLGNCIDRQASGVEFTSYTRVKQDAESLMRAVLKAPVIIRISGSMTAFKYLGRDVIMRDPALCGSNQSKSEGHYMTLVGFGTENGVDYYEFRNSWGHKWSSKGYGRIERGKNICGIENGENALQLWIRD